MLKRLVLGAALFLLVTVPVALGQADLEDVVCFGDSLTHNDLLWIVYGNPRDLYEADPMEAVFNKGSDPGNQLVSFAVGGSESDDLIHQIDLYLLLRFLGTQDQASLFCVEIGGNDVLNNDNLLGANPPGQDPAADAVIDNIISNIKDGLLSLWISNPTAQFVVWTIPDVTLTPDLWNITQTEAANIRAHVERVNQFIRSLNRYNSVVVFDLFKLIRHLVNNTPVLFGHPLVPPPANGNYDNLFADEVHPTAVANGYMANLIIFSINRKWNDGIPMYSAAELADLAHIPH
jgi:lysophospholipase L1-like esterase